MKNIKAESDSFSIQVESGFPGNYTRQTLNHIDSRAILYTSEGNLVVSQLLKYIYPQESKGNFMISYFSSTKQMFLFLGTNPVDNSVVIPKQDLECGQINIKLRFISTTDFPQPIIEDDVSESGDKSGRRTKERKIGYIIEKVAR